MPVVLDVDRINQWRYKQLKRLEAHPISLPPTEKALAPVRKGGLLLTAALMLGAPILLFVVLVPLVAKLGEGAPRIFAYLVFGAITSAMWKVGFSSLREGMAPRSHEDALRKEAKRLAKEGDMAGTVRILSETLTSPWEKSVSPHINQISAWPKKVEGVPKALMVTFDDLRFVEMWLNVSLNSDSAISGVNPDALIEEMIAAASDAGNLGEFAILIRETVESSKEGRKFIDELAVLMKRSAPKAAFALSPACVFALALDQINDWKVQQKSRFESVPLPENATVESFQGKNRKKFPSYERMLVEIAFKLARSRKHVAAVRCLVEIMTLPWKELGLANDRGIYAPRFMAKGFTRNATLPIDLRMVYNDLLFVQCWHDDFLVAYWHKYPDFRKQNRDDMKSVASDNGNLSEFAMILKKVAEKYKGSEPALDNLARMMKQNAPKASALLSS